MRERQQRRDDHRPAAQRTDEDRRQDHDRDPHVHAERECDDVGERPPLAFGDSAPSTRLECTSRDPMRPCRWYTQRAWRSSSRSMAPPGPVSRSVAKQLARRLGYRLLDTGAIYRAVALSRAQGRRGTMPPAARIARDLDIRYQFVGDKNHVYLGGEDVSAAIRTPDVSQGASQVSAHPPVRAALLGIQRRLGQAVAWWSRAATPAPSCSPRRRPSSSSPRMWRSGRGVGWPSSPPRRPGSTIEVDLDVKSVRATSAIPAGMLHRWCQRRTRSSSTVDANPR